MPDIIVDTNVLVDMHLSHRPRHQEALKLKHYLDSHSIRLKIPMHAMFEIASALQSEFRTVGRSGFQISQGVIYTDPVPIDWDFIDRYFEADLPYLRAGDLIFVAMAKRDQALLITEDDDLYKVAKSVGVAVYRTKEFLEQFDV